MAIPCGVNGCLTRLLNIEEWEKHCKTAHPKYYKERIKEQE